MKARYEDARAHFLSNPAHIISVEKKQTRFFLQCIMDHIEDIQKDFNQAGYLTEFWMSNPPENRGYAPKGDKIPWSEVGETTVTPNIVRAVSNRVPDVEFPGLPSGADTRFLLNGHVTHFDVKATGPTDRTDEVVASPNQVSGDGAIWTENGVDNSQFDVYGPRGGHTPFKAELSPLYEINGNWGLCTTFFLKSVYEVIERGKQPLTYLELACVPNGLLLFEDPFYADQIDGLLTPGKDTQGTAHPRTRIKLGPLSKIDPWRSIKIIETSGRWTRRSRAGDQRNLFS